MDRLAPFDLNLIKRDWIEGVSGRAFYQRVQRRIRAIRQGHVAAYQRGVMIVERDPVKFAAAYFAAAYLEVPLIVANPRWGRLEWEKVTEQVNPSIIFGSCPLRAAVRKGISSPSPGSILIPTGGSSGGVKFAIHTWQTLSAAGKGLSDFMGPGAMNWCCVLPLFHVSGLMQLMRAFQFGDRIAFSEFKELRAGALPAFEPHTLCVSLVPTQLQRLMEQKSLIDYLSAARAIFIGGAPTPSAVEARARQLRLPLVLSYGMTETAAMVSALPIEAFWAGSSHAGRPLSHVRIEVCGPDAEACSVGVIGQIRIQGRSLFKAYHGGAELSQSGEFYITGDEGYLDAAGHLHVVGRSDRLVISGGEKIDPREVEEALLRAGSIDQALVLGWPDSEWGQRLIAFYTISTPELDQGQLEAGIRAELANFKIPKQMIRVGALPVNGHGKLDRSLVEDLIRKDREYIK